MKMNKLARMIVGLVLTAAVATGCGSSGGSSSASSTTGDSAAATESTDSSAAVATESEDVSSGRISGGLVVQENPDITTEGKSTDTTINISNHEDIAGIDAFAAPQAGRNDIRYLIYDQLAVMTKAGGDVDEMDWQMAKNIEKVDDTTYNIEIYDYIHDSEGNPITADDIVFCYESVKNSGVSAKFSRLYDSMEKVDDYNLVLHLKSNALGTAQYVLQYVPIVSQKAYESQTEGERSQYPIGTGAYKITDYVSGGYCYLERLDDYWQTDSSKWSYAYSGQAKEIKIVVQTEASQRANALVTGSADVVDLVDSTDIGLFMNDDGTAKDGYNVLKYVYGNAYFLCFNASESSVLNNIHLRKAVSYAIDAKGVMDGTYGENGYVLSKDIVNPLVSDYNPDWDTEDYYDYNIDKAKEELEESGLENVSLRLMTSTLSDEKAMAVFIQQYLSVIGIDVTIDSYDTALETDLKQDATQWDMRLENHGSSDYCSDAWQISFLDSDGLTDFMVVDTEYQDLVAQASNVDTHSQETVDAVHDYLKEQCYFVPFGNYYKYSAAKDTVLAWPLHPYNFLLYGGFITE